MKYYLLDLERTILSGDSTYWKPSRRGYTRHIKDAGLYNKVEASQLVEDDFDKRTIMIGTDVVERLGY